MNVFHDKEHLFALLAQGEILITPNNRLSESLLYEYFNHHQKQTITKPSCLPYSTFLNKSYEQLNFFNPQITHPTLLTSMQCQYLWRKMLKEEIQITYSDGLLQAVISAWERVEQWQISPDDSNFHYTPQTRKFQQWWQYFNDYLQQHHFIAECQIASYLISTNHQIFSQPITWVCFDDFTPQQLGLQNYLQQQGLAQSKYEPAEHMHEPLILTAQNEHEEYQQLMTWLKKQLQENKKHIGVIVPDLQQRSELIHRLFTQNFEPHAFNISLGKPLDEFPLIAHAMCWLQLDLEYINTHQASLLLQSPYLGGAQLEFLPRSEYLQQSALLENPRVPLSALIKTLEPIAPKLAELLSNIQSYPKQASIQEWISFFQERLNKMGFPGDYGISSENYQCLNRLSLAFDEFRQLHLLSDSVTCAEALEAFQYHIKAIIFQPQKHKTPIQISGLLEASGCQFDSLWMMGLTDQCMPQKVHLSAFIPPQLQRMLNMPHSLPARELQFAQQILRRLKNSAEQVVFSYSELQGDTINLPCSLITHFKQFTPLPPTTQQALPKANLIPINENYHFPLQASEAITGGTAILANQAKCPFKAFAEHRLAAKALTTTSDGLNAKERGKIIHKIMELLWQKLENQQKLLTIDPITLDQYIDQAIHTALAPVQEKSLVSYPLLTQEIEYLRLKKLVVTYLEWEKSRPAFTIAALEQSYVINLEGLDFTVRVDRLDQVANKKWVIDYKSSLPNAKPWNQERPQEPQLLLYALLDQQINALLFMQLKTGKISCSGFSEEKQEVSGITSLKKEENWEDYRIKWNEQLTLLAKEFQQGYCHPQPIQPAICQQCEYQNLCRYGTDN